MEAGEKGSERGAGARSAGQVLRTVKVKEDTYRKLLWYKHVMEMNLLAEGEAVRVTMDDVISTMIYLLESAKIRFARVRGREEGGPAEVEPRSN